jgi:hypothetical protein
LETWEDIGSEAWKIVGEKKRDFDVVIVEV